MRIKDNLRRLNFYSKIFNLDDFYNISLGTTCSFQGEFNSELVKKCKSLKMQHHIDSNGYLKFKKHNLEILLT